LSFRKLIADVLIFGIEKVFPFFGPFKIIVFQVWLNPIFFGHLFQKGLPQCEAPHGFVELAKPPRRIEAAA
jgi:hypothetical protein